MVLEAGLDSLSVGYALISEKKALEEQVLDLRQRQLIDYFRILLSLEHFSLFKECCDAIDSQYNKQVQKSARKPNSYPGIVMSKKVKWRKFIGKLPTIYQTHPDNRDLIELTDLYNNLSTSVHSLTQTDLQLFIQQINNCKAMGEREKASWTKLANRIISRFDEIDQRKTELKDAERI